MAMICWSFSSLDECSILKMAVFILWSFSDWNTLDNQKKDISNNMSMQITLLGPLKSINRASYQTIQCT